MELEVERLRLQAYFLLAQFDEGGRTTKRYIDEAIALDRQVLGLCPPGHDMRSESLTRLSVDLSIRYEQFGAIEDIEEGIVLDREALALRLPGHRDRRMSLCNLAFRLCTRYDQLGSISDLDEAIVLGREDLTLSPHGDPNRWISLNNVGTYLVRRYKKMEAMADLNEAIIVSREALSLLPPSHSGRSRTLGNLGLYLTARYEKSGTTSDLNEAIVLSQEAIALRPPGHPRRSTSLNNLADSLFHRYEKWSAISDLDDAIVLTREALSLCLQGHPDRSKSLSNLVLYLSTRYKKSSMTSNLDEAIVLGREALTLRPKGHPLRSSSLQSFAYLLYTRYKLNALSNDLEEVFSTYAELADVTYTVSSGDLEASRAWIRAAEEFKHRSTCLAYETSLQLLVEHLSLLPSLPQHLVILKAHTSSLAVDAFSACLRNGNAERAVELLEQGRSVFWNQLTRLQSSLDDVIASGPAGVMLAKKFAELTTLIRTALHFTEKDQHDHVCHLNSEMQRVVGAIRKLPGFSRFLLPLLFSDLQHAAREGPVVIVNASQYSCDALIVIHNLDPIHVSLSITKEHVADLASRFLGLPKHGDVKNVTYILGIILRELWEYVVFPVVDALQTIRPFQSRIWWCPTAEFSGLPLHAAGPYRRGKRNLPSLYISSYTPTLGALIRARRIHNAGSDAKRFIAIGQANAVGERKLLSVSSELARIGKDVKDAAEFRQIEGEESRISLVAEELRKSEWVHLACHGLPNRREPFKSAFALRDGHFKIERIIRCEMENPEFAYLSACRTTVGDEESPDESIHLASAMQFLGFRSVIGTMWSVDDEATNEITSRFYKLMFDESGRLDYRRAAFALNKTMRTVPKEVTLDQRVLYIHLGA